MNDHKATTHNSDVSDRRLDSIRCWEADGSTLCENVSVSYGSTINSIHYLTKCPTLPPA
jgi:hypothetical protein